LTRPYVIDASCAVLAVLAFIAVVLVGGAGWSVASTAIACFSALIVVAVRRLFLPGDPSLGVVSAMMSLWIFLTTIGWFAYVEAGYPPARLTDATVLDVLFFPLLGGAIVAGAAAFALSRRLRRPSRVAGWRVPVTLASWAIVSLIVAGIAVLLGASSILAGPLSASRLSRAKHVLRVGMSATELCEQYPYRTQTDCLPVPSYRRLTETGLDLQFNSFFMICDEAGPKVNVVFNRKLNVTSWSTKQNGSAC
jgi:hypothetical protein